MAISTQLAKQKLKVSVDALKLIAEEAGHAIQKNDTGAACRAFVGMQRVLGDAERLAGRWHWSRPENQAETEEAQETEKPGQ